jgi:23S rRNA (adenine2503-C2)-methyltransferase
VTFRVVQRERTIGTFDTPEARVFPGSVEKFLLELDDDNAIEAILIGSFGPRVRSLLEIDRAIGKRFLDRLPYIQRKIRYETCISTQVGCALDCHFCASSLVPFVRNLSIEEMLRQIATIEFNIPKGGRLQKVVFAGVGEPLLNYEAVAAVVKQLHARGIPSRINTVGVIPYLEKLFAERLPCELVVSIHAPDDALRAELMPVGRGYPLKDLARVLEKKPEGMLVEAKYLMLNGINDSIDHARALAEYVRRLPVMVTLQMYNRIPELDYAASSTEAVLAFASELRRHAITVGMMNSQLGDPVAGGCGQLRARIGNDRKKRLAVIQ